MKTTTLITLSQCLADTSISFSQVLMINEDSPNYVLHVITTPIIYLIHDFIASHMILTSSMKLRSLNSTLKFMNLIKSFYYFENSYTYIHLSFLFTIKHFPNNFELLGSKTFSLYSNGESPLKLQFCFHKNPKDTCNHI